MVKSKTRQVKEKEKEKEKSNKGKEDAKTGKKAENKFLKYYKHNNYWYNKTLEGENENEELKNMPQNIVYIQSGKNMSDLTIASNLPHLKANQFVRIYNWNVNGIRAMKKKEGFYEFIENESPDILCLNETKIDEIALFKENFNSFLSDKGYVSYWNCCKIKYGYSGVCIFTKYKPISIKHGIDEPEIDQEGRVLTLEFDLFYIVSCYTPNASTGLKRLDFRIKKWDPSFQKYIQKLSHCKKVVLAGDLNVCHQEIDIHDPKKLAGFPGFTREERNSFSWFLELGFIDTFRYFFPDRIDYSFYSNFMPNSREKNEGWRLDYIVVDKNSIDNIEDASIHQKYTQSDHLPISIIWKNF